MRLELKYKIFVDQNAFENVVCEMAAILSRGDELTGIIPNSTEFKLLNRRNFDPISRRDVIAHAIVKAFYNYRRVFTAWISNHVPQKILGCNYSSMPKRTTGSANGPVTQRFTAWSGPKPVKKLSPVKQTMLFALMSSLRRATVDL